MTNNKLISAAEHAAAALSIVREQAKELEAHVAELEKRAKQVARGTGDLTERAAAAVAEATGKPVEKSDTVRDRVINSLRHESLNLSQIAKSSGSASGPVSEVMRALRKEGLVYNVGSAEYPIWTLRIGDQTGTPELTATIRRLISERPMSTQELVAATGARLSRVSGCMVHLLRTEPGMINRGTKRRGIWFLVSDTRPAKLPAKVVVGKKSGIVPQKTDVSQS